MGAWVAWKKPTEMRKSTPILTNLRRYVGLSISNLKQLTRETGRLISLPKSSKPWWLDVNRGLGKTGVVGTLRRGGSNRAIGLRADMDALFIHEMNESGHRSVNKRKMLSCGHDGHTTMLLGAARYLSEVKSFNGTIHFIFQPAGEGGASAKAMMEDGLFEKFACDVVYGLHNMPGIEAGQIDVRAGPDDGG